MSDVVYLLINGKKLDRFTSYEIEADMFAGASSFTVEMARPEITVTAGMECQLWVNDTLELTGIIDAPKPSYSKSGRRLMIVGRDLMGWLIDASPEEFITLEGYTVKRLAERMLRDAPKEFFKITSVDYAENYVGRIKSRAAKTALFDTTTPLSQIEPGMSRFDVLSQYARSKGFLFYCMPNGKFVFGRPKESGTGAPEFFLTNKLNGKGNNILSGDKDDNITKRYSKVTVVGQKQGQNAFTPSQNNVEATLTDPTFPFYKPLVIKDEYGGYQPRRQARLAVEKMRFDGFRLNYTVQGHSQGNKNWSINELAHVVDEDPDFNLNADYLIYGRSFSKSKKEGTLTKLRLGLPGMVA